MIDNLVCLYALDDPLKENVPSFLLSNTGSAQPSNNAGLKHFDKFIFVVVCFDLYTLQSANTINCVFMIFFQIIGSSMHFTHKQRRPYSSRVPLQDVTNSELLLH